MPETAGLLDSLPGWLRERLLHAGHLADVLHVPLYLVGGIVRDLLLHLPNTDVDIVVEGDGIRYAVKLARVYGATIKRHTRFGTATLSFPDGTKLDVATARAERYDAPAALPVVKPSILRHDLQRRDFTMNAMAVRLNTGKFGNMVDPYDGRGDLERRSIRILHPQSFIDDPTRLFRAVRLEQRLGFTLEASTERLFRQAVASRMIDRLSGFRLLEQLRLICEEPDPWPIVSRIDKLVGLQAIAPNLAATPDVKTAFDLIKQWRDSPERHGNHHTPHWWLYLLGLAAPCDDETINNFVNRLRPQAHVAASLRKLSTMHRIEQHIVDGTITSPSDLYHHIHIIPLETVLFFVIASRHEVVRQQCRAYYFHLRHMRLAINGKTLHSLNIPEGPIYRQILNAVFRAKLDGFVSSEQEEQQKALELWQTRDE